MNVNLNKRDTDRATHHRVSRRDFLRLATGSAAVGGAALAQVPGKAAAQVEKTAAAAMTKQRERFPFDLRNDYTPFDQINVIQFGGPATRDPKFRKQMMGYAFKAFDDNRPGYSQLDYALRRGAFLLKFKAISEGLHLDQHMLDLSDMPAPPRLKKLFSGKGRLPGKKPGHMLDVLKGDFVHPKQYRFADRRQAARAIKQAARLYGADLVGITPRDPRFDFGRLWDPIKLESWEWDQFPFVPKSVIVLGFEMDYEAISAAPSFLADAATGEGYSQTVKTAYQLAVFLKNLGYQAVPVENELGLSIPYAELAGLGEHGRHGLLITHKYGPRVRIGKVYTDFDFVEYDRPVNLGVVEFCKRCKRCADQCPTKAITFDDEPGYDPSYNVEGNWFNNRGVKKFYNNTLDCWKWWAENGESCASCITSCPFNKPDFWHHRLVHDLNALMPGPLHSFMRDMDKVFGYGDTFDPKAAARFWNKG